MILIPSLYEINDAWSLPQFMCNTKLIVRTIYEIYSSFHKIQGRWSWVCRVRICAPNVRAMNKENLNFAHPIHEPYFMIAHPILNCFHRHCHEFLYDSLMDFFVLVTSQTSLNKEIFTQRLGDLHFVPLLLIICKG